MKRSFVLPTLAAALLAGSTLTHGSAVGAPVGAADGILSVADNMKLMENMQYVWDGRNIAGTTTAGTGRAGMCALMVPGYQVSGGAAAMAGIIGMGDILAVGITGITVVAASIMEAVASITAVAARAVVVRNTERAA